MNQVCLNETGAVWACGIDARDQLIKFIGKRDVRCEGKKYDTVYRNRRISNCRIDGESISLNQWLVREGWALNFEPYAKSRFKADQDEAREKKSRALEGLLLASASGEAR
jgi:endonuclease YncB( thermonuclease family)